MGSCIKYEIVKICIQFVRLSVEQSITSQLLFLMFFVFSYLLCAFVLLHNYCSLREKGGNKENFKYGINIIIFITNLNQI